jgi:nitrite reductase/ring-hydroxylating ferredoxin subunit
VTFDMTWFDVADVADLEGLDVIGVETAGRKLAIFRLGSDYYATSNVCTHPAGVLSDGEGSKVTSNARCMTGSSTSAPARRRAGRSARTFAPIR